MRRGVLPGVLLGLLCVPRPSAGQAPDLVVQEGHSGRVAAMDVSPDGYLLAAAEQSRARVKLWDLRTGLLLRTIESTGADFADLEFGPEGRTLAGVTVYGQVLVFDVGTGSVLRDLGGWSPLPEGAVDLPTDLEQLREVEGLGLDAPGFGTFNSRWPVAVGSDGTVAAGMVRREGESQPANSYGVHLWDPAGDPVQVVPEIGEGSADSAAPVSLTFTPDGAGLAVGWNQGSVAVVESRTASLRWEARVEEGRLGSSAEGTEGIRDLSFSPDGLLLAVTVHGGVEIRDGADGRILQFLNHPGLAVGSSQFVAEASTLVTGTASGTIHVWDWEAGEVVRELDLGGSDPIGSVRRVPGTTTFAAGVGTRIVVGDWGSGQAVRLLEGRARKVTAVLTPDAEHILTSGAGALFRWERGTGRLLRTVPGLPGEIAAIRTDPAGLYGAVVGSDLRTGEGELSVVDLESGAVSWSFRAPGVLESPAFSPDGALLAVLIDRSQAVLLDAARGQEVAAIPMVTPSPESVGTEAESYWPSEVFSIELVNTPGGLRLLSAGRSRFGVENPNVLNLWTAEGAPMALPTGEPGPFLRLATGLQGRLWAYAFPEGTGFRVLDWAREMGNEEARLPGSGNAMAFHPTKPILAVGSLEGYLWVWDVESATLLADDRPSLAGIETLSFSSDGRFLFFTTLDGASHLWNAETLSPVARLFFDEDARLIVTADHHYLGDKSLFDAVGFRVGGRAYPFDQFDLKHNRPDLVVEAIGGPAEQRLTDLYRRAHRRRMGRMGLSEEIVAEEYHLPTVEIDRGSLPAVSGEKVVSVPVRAADDRVDLDRVVVTVNGVPLHGSAGVDLRGEGTRRWESTLEVELTEGPNRIQVSVFNTRGAESLRETSDIRYIGPAPGPELFLLAVGVSRYAEEAYNLTYASSDADSLVSFFESSRTGFKRVHTLKIQDGDATRERIEAAREFLAQSGPDDQVVVFFAGHGLLDENLDYYFGTADMDFDYPAARGLPYSAIEGLLDGIQARRKLLFMDTCHSGEVDSPGAVESLPGGGEMPDAVQMRRVQPRTRVSGRAPVAPDTSNQLLEELFADLRVGSGAFVISAAAGAEFAYEADRWANGVFTFALLRGLNDGAADADGDGSILVTELRSFVAETVRTLTNGLQTPTMRSENIVLDFPVF